MQNIPAWKPSKYELYRGRLRASRDVKEAALSSRLGIDLVAKFYQDAIPEYARGHLIDLGCGKVPLYHVYNKHVEKVTCVDWANTFHKNSHLDIIQDLNEALKIPDDNCDTIILSDVLEHIREPKFLMAEIARVLRKDGKVIMNVPFYYWLHEQPFDFFRYTEHALQYFAEETGLEVIKLEPYGGSIEIVADVLSKQLLIIPLIGKLMTRFIQFTMRHWTNSTLGKKMIRKTGKVFPLGYVMVLIKK